MTPGKAVLIKKKLHPKKSFRKNLALKEENMLNGLHTGKVIKRE